MEWGSDSPWLRVHFLDVGYGDAILIESSDFAIMIDTGEKKFSQRILDYLSDRDITSIDAALITHPHKNHFEGFLPLLDKIKIKSLYINGETNAEAGYAELLSAFRQKSIPVKTVKSGSKIETPINGLTVEILHPNNLSADPNGNSLVTWLRFQETYFLFTADIGESQQDHLIGQKSFIKKAHLIQIPHHGGSASESWAAFFRHPIFVLSTGENQWGIPDETKLKKLTAPVWRTDQHGTVVIESDGQRLKILSSKHGK